MKYAVLRGNQLKGVKPYKHYLISELLHDKPPLVPIKPNATLNEALQRMFAKNYSQLPVITQDGRCNGAITFESILRTLTRKEKIPRDYLTFPVSKYIDDNPAFVRMNDEILKHVTSMADNGYVLVGNPAKVTQIITNYDIVHFFKNNTELFLIINEIETCLRHIVKQNLDEKTLRLAIERIAEKEASLEKLTFSQLIGLIFHKWHDLERIFGDRTITRSQLDTVRDYRNRVFHFRDILNVHELQSLKRIRDNHIKLAGSLS